MIRLTQLRIDKLLTVEELAEATDVKKTTIYNLESGLVSRPRMDNLRKLSQFFDVPASELLRATEREAA